MTLADILGARLGSGLEGGKLHVRFKKTVSVRAYESEVIEADLEIPLETIDESVMLVEEIALAKLEYSTMASFLSKGLIKQTEFDRRAEEIAYAVNQMENVVKQLTDRRKAQETAGA